VGGYAAAREVALQRIEGRDYVIQDGDVVNFRFTPP
jgi:ribosome-binding ATPase YchF (GTP1/OBG family)